MAGKVVVNLSSGPEDPDAVTVAFLVADSALSSGKELVIFLTREAVHLALPGEADKVVEPGYRPVGDLFKAVAEAGGELYCCKPCCRTRGIEAEHLVPNARIAGGMALFEWMGDEPAAVFSY
ncbi:MAG: DsrE family protein [Gaiellales bacterium]